MPTSFHAIVIGGGPAGGVAALKLARMGWRVLLAERQGRHRDKACGHCLSARGVAMLESLGLRSKVAAISRGRTDVLRLHVSVPGPLEFPLRCRTRTGDRQGSSANGPAGILVQRNELDQMILDAAAEAGATIMQPASARIESIAARGAMVTIRLEQQDSGNSPAPALQCVAPLIIGADGLGSRVSRHAGLGSRPRSSRRYGFSMTFEDLVVAGLGNDAIDMFVADEGYLGIVRTGTGVHHLAALARPCSGRHLSPTAFLERFSRRFPTLREACKLASAKRAVALAAGPMPWRVRRVASDRVALLGDAAGFVEPITGEGITWSIESALLLSRSLRDVSPGTWNRSTAAIYQRLWRRQIGARHRFCRCVSRILEHPGLIAAMTRTWHSWPVLARPAVRRVVAT